MLVTHRYGLKGRLRKYEDVCPYDGGDGAELIVGEGAYVIANDDEA